MKYNFLLIKMSGFYDVTNLANFTVSNYNKNNFNQIINPIIIYASFELTSDGEFKIHPINLKPEYGYFLVSQPSTTMFIQFVANDNIKKVLGMISFNYPYSVEQVSDTIFQFNLSGLPTPTPFFGTISLMIAKK